MHKLMRLAPALLEQQHLDPVLTTPFIYRNEHQLRAVSSSTASCSSTPPSSSGSGPSSTAPSWASRLKAALFPMEVSEGVPSQQNAASLGRASPSMRPMRPPAMQHTPQTMAPSKLRQASQHQQQQRSLPFEVGGRPVSKQTERVMANLFKASLLLISLPMAAHVVCVHLITASLVKGLKNASDPIVLRLTLQRIQSWMRFGFLASQFEDQDGVMHLLHLLNEDMRHMEQPTVDVYLQAVRHLMQFDVTQQSMLLGGMVEKLERALSQDWFPAGSRQLAKAVYLDIHAQRRMHMEQLYGQVDKHLAQPKQF